MKAQKQTKASKPQSTLADRVERNFSRAAFESVKELATKLDTTPGVLLFDALRIAKPHIEKEAAERALHKTIADAWNYRGKNFNETVGFDKEGKLVWCDGKQVKPMTLVESVKWVAKMKERYADTDFEIDETSSLEPHAKWFGMVAAAIK